VVVGRSRAGLIRGLGPSRRDSRTVRLGSKGPRLVLRSYRGVPTLTIEYPIDDAVAGVYGVICSAEPRLLDGKRANAEANSDDPRSSTSPKYSEVNVGSSTLGITSLEVTWQMFTEE
jgi:hypothetical protein